MHPKEFKKEKNGTGHMTNLQLENAEIIVGVDFTNCNRVNALLNKENSTSFLLYPGMNNFNLSVREASEVQSFIGQQANIFILDGTWPCARKMLKLSKNLQDLSRISFDNTIQSKFIIKQQPESLCLSTIESVQTVINLLNNGGVENCDTKDFLLPFEKMIEHQIECILNPDNKNHHRPKSDTVLTPKTLYKKDSERNIIFEQNR
jgi:DTW domain-containing protein YfiP